MTEFEIATIAYQNSSLDLQLYAIWAQVGVGLLHAALIGSGLWMMHRASRDRNKTMDEDRVRADQRHEEAMRNHEEAMTALKELIVRTASPSPPPASPAG